MINLILSLPYIRVGYETTFFVAACLKVVYVDNKQKKNKKKVKIYQVHGGYDSIYLSTYFQVRYPGFQVVWCTFLSLKQKVFILHKS